MKFHLRFYECEHQGDLYSYIDELTSCGASVLESELNEDQEEAVVKVEVADFKAFKAAWEKTFSAISAARNGASTLLIENQGFLGGVWTAGLLTHILDEDNKTGLMLEIRSRLNVLREDRFPPNSKVSAQNYDCEDMKFVLEALCSESGVALRYLTRVVAAHVDENRRLTHIVTESKAGREAWGAAMFIDCTGDGDLGALAGCNFSVGHPETGKCQPMTLMALVGGPRHEDMAPYIWGGLPEDAFGVSQKRFIAEIERSGHPTPSYEMATLFEVRDGLYAMMANHQYGISAIDSDGITRSTVEARAEVHGMVRSLRGLGGVWKDLELIATAPHIGVREGRRIHGRKTVTGDDLVSGAQHEDSACDVTFCVDIHSLDPKASKGFHNGGIKVKPYQIPLGALIAKDVEGLMMAGRCISGDFFAHASYRVTGNAVAMGESAGMAAAAVVRKGEVAGVGKPPVR